MWRGRRATNGSLRSSAARNALWHEERRYREHWARVVPRQAWPPADEPRIPAELLYSVLRPGPALERMVQAVQRQRSMMPQEVAWFSQLTHEQSRFLDYFIALEVLPFAMRQSQEIQRQRDVVAAAQRGRELEWARREQERLSDSAAARGLTLKFLIPSIAAMAFLLLPRRRLPLQHFYGGRRRRLAGGERCRGCRCGHLSGLQ